MLVWICCEPAVVELVLPVQACHLDEDSRHCPHPRPHEHEIASVIGDMGITNARRR